MNYSDRRTFVICLAVILSLSIPLCVFVFLVPPKIAIFWWPDSDLTSNGDQQQSKSSPPLLLLISYDGFRYDYVEKTNNTPTFRWLIQNGVHATQGLKNTYITITAPNHYGIVSGLFEESHGVVANDFYDPDLKIRFDYFDSRWKTDPRMFNGVPVWNLNDAAGADRATGCVMWVGCDVPIKGHLPQHFVSWDQNLAWTARVDALISWYKHPERPINFGILYIEEPDETGHRFGPDSPELAATVQKMDQLTAYLMWRLYTENLLDRMNIIFTADHGMSTVPSLNAVSLDNYVNRSLYTVYGGTPNWNVDPKPGHEAEVYNALKDKVPHLNVYNKTNIPADYHYRNNSRIMPLQLVTDVHWWLTYNYTGEEQPATIERTLRGKKIVIDLKKSNYSTGEHGYNNSHPEMHPYFIGYGPAFKKGYNVSQFMNLDLYPLMCYILNVEPAPNNASFERVREILKDNGRQWASRNYAAYSKGTPMTTARTPGVTVEYEYSTDDDYFHSFFYSNNCDFLLMFTLLMAYVLLMTSTARKLKKLERENNRQSTTTNSSSEVKDEKSFYFYA